MCMSMLIRIHEVRIMTSTHDTHTSTSCTTAITLTTSHHALAHSQIWILTHKFVPITLFSCYVVVVYDHPYHDQHQPRNAEVWEHEAHKDHAGGDTRVAADAAAARGAS